MSEAGIDKPEKLTPTNKAELPKRTKLLRSVRLSMWLNPEAKSGEPEWPRDCNEAETPGCAEDKAETARPEQA